MKSSTRLDSVVFQLTPTRTRCDLVITANGKAEKLASGLLNPFLAHLKAAQEQIGKGGYSVILQPGRGIDAPWFTKGTVERFVRFVSTPEILERVYTIESEILQIQEAISFQGNNDPALNSVNQQVKFKETIEGSKLILGSNEEKAIVLYKPNASAPETDGSVTQEGNSKVQLLKVLEARKSVLQKEQGMAFARAVAAGFDVDHIAPLMSFAGCFGASRMMDACSRFTELWKAKHESGQWMEIEAAEAMSFPSDIPALNASGIAISVSEEQRDLKEARSPGEIAGESNGMQSIPSNPGPFAHPMYPPWPIHPQGNQLPACQQYPVPMPYYQNYPANNPYFQAPYFSADESRLHASRKTGHRRHPMGNREISSESENEDADASRSIMQDRLDMEEDQQMWEGRKKGVKSMRKKSGMVVIRNINYITSNKKSSGGDSESSSGSEIHDEDVNVDINAPKVTKKNSLSKTNRKGGNSKFAGEFKMLGEEDRASRPEKNDGHWQAFQNFLLKDTDEDDSPLKRGMFGMEGKGEGKKRQTSEDPSVHAAQNPDGTQYGRFIESHDISRDMDRMLKPSNDEGLAFKGRDGFDNGGSSDAQMHMATLEMGVGSGVYRRTAAGGGDDVVIHGREKMTYVPIDPLMGNGLDAGNDQKRSSSHKMADESFIVPCRLSSLDQVGSDGRTTIDVYSEVPPLPGAEERPDAHNYEANDLNLMPERTTENVLFGYNSALDFEMQGHIENTTKHDSKTEIDVDVNKGPRKYGKEQGFKAERKDAATARKGKPSKFSPSDEARARAERLRTFKADLQKLKKEKEEEQVKRIEALKMARQKRIAARGSVTPAHSSLPMQQTKRQLPKTLSPTSHKGSKFSDTEPGPPSPLQRSTIRTISKVSSNSRETLKSGRLNYGIRSSGNKLTRSASSLSEPKLQNSGVSPAPQATMARIRRLSEPKSNKHNTPVSRSADSISKRRVSGGFEKKKIPPVVNLDKTKSATPPDLKTRKSKGSLDATSGKSSTKEVTQTMNSNKYSNKSASAKLNGGSDKLSSHCDVDDNPVVEKTVVMLECGKPSIPVAVASEESKCIQIMRDDKCHDRGKPNGSLENQVLDSDAARKEIGEEPIESSVRGVHDMNAAGKTHTDRVVPNTPSISIMEKHYQPPYARVSSVEDPCTVKSEYGKAPPRSLEDIAMSGDFSKAHIPDSRHQRLQNLSEAAEKPLGKESSKGFKKLLKFGKKNHNSAPVDPTADANRVSVDGFVTRDDPPDTGFPGEVYTLKNLISQAETAGNSCTPPKSSRTFSLFSPFRSKSGEKKLSK